MSGKISKITYTSFRNQLTAILRRAKHLHYVKLFYNTGCAPNRSGQLLIISLIGRGGIFLES